MYGIILVCAACFLVAEEPVRNSDSGSGSRLELGWRRDPERFGEEKIVRGLKCGIDQENIDDMNGALGKCMNERYTNSDDRSSSESTSSEEFARKTNTPRRGLSRIARAAQTYANKAVSTETPQPSSGDVSNGFGNGTQPTQPTQQPADDNATTNGTMDPTCLLQCFFHHLEMTDEDGLPDHQKVAARFLRKAAQRELRDFITDSTDECFQRIDQEKNKLNACEFSNHLAVCLAEKGRTNCSDWPTGDLPINPEITQEKDEQQQ